MLSPTLTMRDKKFNPETVNVKNRPQIQILGVFFIDTASRVKIISKSVTPE